MSKLEMQYPVKDKVGMPSLIEGIKCTQCEKCFASSAQQRSHMWRKHGVKAPQWSKAWSSTCEACHIDFRSRTRLLTHWKQKSKCWLAVQQDGKRPATQAEVAELDERDRAAATSAAK